MTREEAIKEIKSWAIPSERGREVLETLIPELVESEDERIRKEINILYSEIDTCISELLKARTDKDLEAEVKAFFKMEGLMVATLQDLSCIEDYLEKHKENTWSEEDDEKVKVMCTEGDLKPPERAWLKDLRNRVWKEQKPAEINEYEIIKKHITEDVLSSEVNKRLKECGWYVTEEPVEWNEEDEKNRCPLNTKEIKVGDTITYFRNGKKGIMLVSSFDSGIYPRCKWGITDIDGTAYGDWTPGSGPYYAATEKEKQQLYDTMPIEVKNWLKSIKPQSKAEWSDNFEENIRNLLHDKLTWHSEDGSMSSTVFIDDKTLKDIINGIWFYVGKEALKYPSKELNVTEWSEEDIKKIRSEEYTKGFNDAAFGGKLKKWSVEDEDRIRQIERIAQQAGCTQKLQEEIHDWLKSLRPQPKQEWSEEDDDFINMLILHFNYLIDKGGDSVETYKSYIEKLKSLRPQPKQELSEKESRGRCPGTAYRQKNG